MNYDSALPAISGVDLAGLNTDSLVDLEAFFHRASTVEAAARLLTALAVHKIVSQELYKPEFATRTAYFEAAPGRLRISAQTVSHLFNSADFYLIHHAALEAGGFRISGDFSKLRHASYAAEFHPVDEVIHNILTMSFRDFLEYAYPKTKKLIATESIQLANGAISAGGKKLVSIAQVKKILNQGRTPFLVGVESPREKALIEDFLKKIRQG